MKRVPVDVSKFLSARCAGDPETKKDYDSGAIAPDRATGWPVWQVGVTVRVPDERKAETIEVNVVGEKPPAVADGDLVSIEGMTVALWERDGRAGLTFRAESMTKIPAPSPAASAPAVSQKAARGGESA
jgi:hypothetical protein